MTLSDDFPVLLAPVRVETRFTQTELLVRVFPDEWAVDKFEPKPTPAEIAALDAFWTARWAAGGREAPLRAAWQELAARVPAGRADWLLRTRVPANPNEEPAGVAPGAAVLVVRSATPVAANDRAPSVTYWTAVWRAHGDRGLLRQADVALDRAVSNNPTRANGIRTRRPSGVDAAVMSATDDVVVAFLVLPAPATGSVAADAWTQGARARLLPDRFQVFGFAGGQQVVSVTGAAVPATLAVSPDPASGDQISVNEQTGVLHVPEDLRWLVDFDRAVQVGMGVRIPLTDQIRGGLERLVVLGLREGATPTQSAAALTDLITRHLRSPDGFALLPQGTPTNNSEAAAAGQDAEDEAESVRTQSITTAAHSPASGASQSNTESGPPVSGLTSTETAREERAGGLRAQEGRHREQAHSPASGASQSNTDWTTRTDGQQLVDLLGLSPTVLTGMPNANSTDVRDARAANTALWPATWGYFLQTALHPLLSPAAVAATRDFFLTYVSGRGPLPAVKIGRQPYGILPTTAFSRLAFPAAATHRRALNRVLTEAGLDWAAAAEHVPHLGGEADDAHQHLLDILALHPTSAEYHQRYGQSVEDLFNRENLGGLGATVLSTVDALGLPATVRELLGRFGTSQDPDLLRRLFVDFQQPLLAPLVDDRPLSETDRIRPYTTDGRDYVSWLADLARADLDRIRLEADFAQGGQPATLLYLLLRHALLLGWDDAARALAAAAGVPAGPPVDPAFIHVHLPAPGEETASESRFRLLYSPNPPVTGDPDQLLVDFIPTVLSSPQSSSGPTAALDEQARALDVLRDLPTAKLERVLAEHLDLATYRLDGWRLGLATERLTELRFTQNGTVRPGLHLGAYGFLENVAPDTTPLEPVTLTGPLATVFAGGTPLMHDPDNKGFAHAPSLSHARTAAVLRAGHVANETPETPGTFAVNLSSARVRVALSILDGMRQGQSLGALLGYRFERGLHDRHAEAEVDQFIAGLRLRFPLRAGKIPQTADAEPDEIGQVEARNVIDGLALVRHLSRTGVSRLYPFDLDGLPPASTAQAEAISQEAESLLDTNDAVADLAVAEATHQALAGNPERASATLDAYAKDGLPPEPAVVQTPRGGTTLTHRFGLWLRTGLNPSGGDSPRAQAEPAVDDWLPALLPPARSVVAVVTWTDPDGDARREEITQEDLDISPIDLLWLSRPVGDAAMTDLDDRIIGAVVDEYHPRPDTEPTIRYTERAEDDDKITFFELSPLIAALRTLLTTGRPLRPTDLMPPAGPTTVDRSLDDAISVSRQRPEAVRESLDDLADDVADYLRDLNRLYPPAPALPRRREIVEDIDSLLTRYAELATTAGGFGMIRSGWGELTAWRRGVFTGVLAEVATTADRMARALAEATTLLAAYDALPNNTPNNERFRLLRAIERLIRTTPDPDPPDRPRAFRDELVERRGRFADKIAELRGIAGTGRNTLSGLLDEVDDRRPPADMDPGADLTPLSDRVVTFGAELLSRARALAAEITARMTAAAAALAEAAAAVTDPDEARASTDALRALLGEDVLVVPEYTLTKALGDELHDAFDDREDLVRHLTQAPVSRDFPVDDWLHGVARVREMPRLWERVVLLRDALRDHDGLLADDPDDEPRLHPVQLPFRSNDHWLAMELASGATIDQDRLLFTAHYADEPSSGDGPACGLLFDEWTEVLPVDRETTGIAVHADSPDSEPPQSMLLVVPPVRTGTWQVSDLVAAVTETFDLARTRLVEPAQLDDTGYAQLLPATVLSATRRPITISTDLATANARWKADHD